MHHHAAEVRSQCASSFFSCTWILGEVTVKQVAFLLLLKEQQHRFMCLWSAGTSWVGLVDFSENKPIMKSCWNIGDIRCLLLVFPYTGCKCFYNAVEHFLWVIHKMCVSQCRKTPACFYLKSQVSYSQKMCFPFAQLCRSYLWVFFGVPVTDNAQVSSISLYQWRPILWWVAVKYKQLIELDDYFPVLSTCEAA